MKRKGGLAWLPAFIAGAAATTEEAFWLRRSFEGRTVYDVGAFQGLLTLFFARQARQVASYEPNSRNHARLIENVRLNGLTNVLVRKVGVGSEPSEATLVASRRMMGGASVDRDMVAGLLASGQPVVSEQIPIVTLDDDIRNLSLPAPDFIKVDIEGRELAALQGARRTLLAHRPHLFLEMHGETMNAKRKNVSAIVEWLSNEAGYTDILHVESGERISAVNSSIAAEGHLFCRP
jgi:FkbM family methyltransferase